MLRLDYLSCVLTIVSTVLVGKKMWHGWIVAGVNSVVICWIGIRTAQFGFVPANLFCIGLYANNLCQWRLKVPKRSNAESRVPLPTLSYLARNSQTADRNPWYLLAWRRSMRIAIFSALAVLLWLICLPNPAAAQTSLAGPLTRLSLLPDPPVGAQAPSLPKGEPEQAGVFQGLPSNQANALRGLNDRAAQLNPFPDSH